MRNFDAHLKKMDRKVCRSVGLDFAEKSRRSTIQRGCHELSTTVKFSVRSVMASSRARAAGMHIIARRSEKGKVAGPEPCASISKVVAGIPKLILTAFCTSYMPLFFVSPMRETIKLSRSN